MDVQKQIEYWKAGAEDDYLSAEILIEKNRLLHGLFFCHLVIEKAIKAHVVKQTQEVAPRTHNLILLSEKARLDFEEDDEIFLGILMKYQLQGRYPDYNPGTPEREKSLGIPSKNKNTITMDKFEIIKLLKQYILLLNSEGINVSRAFLFGSYSNNTASIDSDIDVLIVSDNYNENNDLVIGKMWKLTRRINSKIEPFLIGEQKFKDEDGSPFIQLIKTTGIEIA